MCPPHHQAELLHAGSVHVHGGWCAPVIPTSLPTIVSRRFASFVPTYFTTFGSSRFASFVFTMFTTVWFEPLRSIRRDQRTGRSTVDDTFHKRRHVSARPQHNHVLPLPQSHQKPPLSTNRPTTRSYDTRRHVCVLRTQSAMSSSNNCQHVPDGVLKRLVPSVKVVRVGACLGVAGRGRRDG